MVWPPVPVTAILEPHAVLPERQPLFGRLAGTGTGTFWHVTDWHVNEFQPPDANADDMCRTAAASASTEQPGSFGHPECDPTPAGWRAALAEMSSLQPAPDFIYAGGDWFGHVAKEHDTERAVRSSALMIARLLEQSFPGAPVLHAIGNHDTWPYYSQASTWLSMERDWAQALGEAYIARNFPGAALASWRRGGYFARRITPSLQAVVLNTNDLALGGGAEQLAWLETEMVAARRRGGKVLLMGHIPNPRATPTPKPTPTPKQGAADGAHPSRPGALRARLHLPARTLLPACGRRVLAARRAGAVAAV